MMKVRSGAEASNDEIIYKFTTEDAKSYLQKKFNMIKAAFEKKGVNFPDIKLIMYNQELGKNFLPFILILPDTVLESRNRNENYNSIFLPDTKEQSARLKKPFFDLLSNYTYNKDDKKAFRSPDWKRRSGVNGRHTSTLLKYSTPVKESFGSAGTKVLVFIDPIRIFHDMLVIEGREDQVFDVDIRECKKIENGNYNFKMARVVDMKKSSSTREFYGEIVRRINNQ